MVHPSLIHSRLGELQFKASRWFSAEINELQHILQDNEKIIALVCGRYFGSFALLVATDQRLLLIDKRVFFMNIEDTRYDMISEIDFNAQIYSATVNIHTMNKVHKFTSVKNKSQLLDLTNYVQRRVFELRSQQPDATDAPQSILNMSSNRQAARPLTQSAAQSYQGIRSEMRQSDLQPNDFYTDNDNPQPAHTGGQVWRGQIGHVAHKLGSAAKKAAHRSSHFPHRPTNPYLQGSLMTRRPIGTNYPSQNY
jgi:hypothetical protein